MKRILLFSSLIIFLALFPSRLNPQVSDALKVTVLFTSDINGYVEPCG
jgi:hypothetical protein